MPDFQFVVHTEARDGSSYIVALLAPSSNLEHIHLEVEQDDGAFAETRLPYKVQAGCRIRFAGTIT